MKVIHFIDSGGLYGAEKMLLALVTEQLADTNISPLIVSVGLPGEPEKPLERAAREQGLPCKVWRMPAGLRLNQTRQLLHDLLPEHAQVVLHSHGYKFNILLAALKTMGEALPPLVSTVHGYVQPKRFSKMWVYEKLDRWALGSFDRVICVSQHQISHHLPTRLSKHAAVIYNGILPRPNLPKARPAWPASFTTDRPLRLLGVGRLSYEKGFDRLISALARLTKRGISARLTLAGTGPEEQALRAQARELSVAQWVDFAGYVTPVDTLFDTHDLLVMPSRTEGLPILLLEALQAGIPVMASAVGGIPEVAECTDSVLTLFGDDDDLAEQVVRVVRSLSDLSAMALPANFEARQMADQYRQLYNAVMSERERGALHAKVD